jgi:hypothetical protein
MARFRLGTAEGVFLFKSDVNALRAMARMIWLTKLEGQHSFSLELDAVRASSESENVCRLDESDFLKMFDGPEKYDVISELAHKMYRGKLTPTKKDALVDVLGDLDRTSESKSARLSISFDLEDATFARHYEMFNTISEEVMEFKRPNSSRRGDRGGHSFQRLFPQYRDAKTCCVLLLLVLAERILHFREFDIKKFPDPEDEEVGTQVTIVDVHFEVGDRVQDARKLEKALQAATLN